MNVKQPKRYFWMQCFHLPGLWSPGVGQRRRYAIDQAHLFFPCTLHSQVSWFFPGTPFYNLGLSNMKAIRDRELPDVQAGFRKGRGTRDQIANI